MSEMVERVAMAIIEEFKRQRLDPFSVTTFTGIIPPLNKLALGQVAIRAMREPTEAMEIVAGRDNVSDDHLAPWHTWTTMIDEALR